jgi:RNA polymerase sigma-70 factor, ECF subfamily
MIQGDIELSDEALIARCQRELPSNTRSYELLVQRHMDHVYTMVYRMIPNREDAEDVTQDIFIKVYHTLASFEHKSSFSTWLHRITINCAIDASQKLKRRGVHLFTAVDNKETQTAQADGQLDRLDTQISSQPGPEERALQKEQRECINHVFQALNREQTRVLVMRDVEDFSYEEMASSLEVGLSAVKMRIHRARLAFQQLFLQLCDQTRLAFSVTFQQQMPSKKTKGKPHEL